MIYENNWIFDSDFLLGKAGKHPEKEINILSLRYKTNLLSHLLILCTHFLSS